MGYFAGLIVCVLREEGDTIRSNVDAMMFRNNAYVSWQAGELPEEQWVSHGCKTIYFKKSGDVMERTTYDADMIKKINYKFPKQGEAFKFKANLFFNRRSLLHVVLPYLYVPDLESFGKGKPQHIKKMNDRISLTWPFDTKIDPEFHFYKVNKKTYDKFSSVGTPIEVKISPKISQRMEKIGKKIGKKAEDIGVNALGVIVSNLMSS